MMEQFCKLNRSLPRKFVHVSHRRLLLLSKTLWAILHKSKLTGGLILLILSYSQLPLAYLIRVARVDYNQFLTSLSKNDCTKAHCDKATTGNKIIGSVCESLSFRFVKLW